MASFTLVREIAAPPETIFEVLTDHRGYAGTPRAVSLVENRVIHPSLLCPHPDTQFPSRREYEMCE